jgi:hypothetical protein
LDAHALVAPARSLSATASSVYSWTIASGTEHLAIADPALNREQTCTMQQLDNGQYQDGGTWTHTYRTHP